MAMVARPSAITRWLAAAPPAVVALWGGGAAFATYFAMYAYRKPFAAARFANIAGWPFAIDYKVVLVIAQVAGYALSKLIGIRVVSAMPAGRRAVTILGLIGFAEAALIVFAVAPPLAGVAALFANGLALGLIWGLVFAFLEGRRMSEIAGAMLCATFIVASGAVKAVGAGMIDRGWTSEAWMPAATGLLFVPLLLAAVAALAQLPPPNAADVAARAPRAPMTTAERRRLFRAHAGSLILLIAVYVVLTAVRDFRDNFAAEVWHELGFAGEAGIFAWSELPVAAIVLAALGLLARVRGNRAGVAWNLALVGVGLGVMGLATAAFALAALGPVAWMIALGAGLYLAYTPFNALLFDRLLAASAERGNAGFFIYVADAAGYVGSVALLGVRSFAHVTLHFTAFLAAAAYAACGFGGIATVIAGVRLLRTLPPERIDL